MRVDLNPEKVIYENSPASEWNEAFPLGNGALGAMISGGLMEETFDLNQESIWSGGPRNRNNPDALSRLPEIRKLIREGRPDLAEQTALYAMAGTPESESVYQPLGRFTLNFDLNRPGRGLPGEAEPVPEDYLRKLDLEEAVVTVSFTRNGIQTLREHFVSAPAGCFVSRIICDSSGSLNFSGRFSRSGLTAFSGRSDGGADGGADRETALVLRSEGAGEGAVRFAAGARIIPVGGTVEFLGDHCIVRNAHEVLILIACRTSFFDKDYEQKMLEDLDRAAGRSWESLLKEHVEDYSALFGRTELSFSAAGEDCETLSTSRRLGALKEGCDDTALIPLYLNFGKYLMISSSRPGTLPSNLQGIWNPHDAPPWGSKYTININTQMNYWLAEPCGLGDCHRALFDHILRMIPNGRVTAESMYGCRGFTAHHNTDLWGDTAPQDHWMPATFWCLGGAWLCLHLIEHHDFTRDREFLMKFY
ncbi:MAG: glycoside hydrolase family 95 protein, partial [Spirochaetales bacterium]|nr:glycoside hydrolase family 95 protein [Spirochaetales bacterium]